jgi:hypothetical protein
MRWNPFQKRHASRSATTGCKTNVASSRSVILGKGINPKITEIRAGTHHEETDGTDSTSTSDPAAQSGLGANRNVAKPFHGRSSMKCRTTRKKIVRFDTVESRVYKRIVGDHPHTEIPLSISWEYAERPSVAVSTFESEKEIRKLAEPKMETKMVPKIPKGIKTSPGSVMVSPKRGSSMINAAHRSSTSIMMNNNSMIEPISVGERVQLLKNVSGYTNTEIQQAERRRKVQAMMEWAYRFNRDDLEHPCSVPNCELLYNRYVR